MGPFNFSIVWCTGRSWEGFLMQMDNKGKMRAHFNSLSNAGCPIVMSACSTSCGELLTSE